ncbi:MAG: family 10 glycosylhydrolase [Planctomycetes bacterium]|nr:family 10 glycosylhydrolase [Planctomycetota bacterium]
MRRKEGRSGQGRAAATSQTPQASQTSHRATPSPACRALLAWIGLLAILGLGPRALAAEEGRAFWLTRWNARSRDEIVRTLDGMVALRANILFCQVYGDAMALYRSRLAPRSHLVEEPFDALAAAVDEGHRHGIKVHAWMNTCNVYSGGLGTPPDPTHVVRAHPEWAVVASDGRSDLDFLGDPDALIFFCPEWDGFRDYCGAVASEIASSYAVDGIHLDYTRVPVGAPRCFCREHARRFAARFGRAPEHTDPDFIEMRYETIARLFAGIYDAVTAVRPRIAVSAALVAPSRRYFQDARRVLEAGKLDIAVPMVYTPDLAVFEERARGFHESSGGRLVLAGISIATSEGKVQEEVEAARRIGLEGQALFSYSTLDAAARAELESLWAAPAAVPGMPWKDGSPDRVAPVISGVTVGGVLPEEATVLFHTDERARGRVELGLTARLGSTVEGGADAFDHAVRLRGLKPDALYHYRVAARDAAGNETVAPASTFRTGSSGPVAVVVDDGGAGFTVGGPWSSGTSAGGNDGDYLFTSDQPQETAWAEFRPFLPLDGEYEVALWYVAGSNRVADAPFTVVHAGGKATFEVSQKTGGQRWNALGRFPFETGTAGHVRLSNQASGGDVVIADAVRFLLTEAAPRFVRGDANDDGAVDISDAVAILAHLFLGGGAPRCPDAADANDSGKLDLSDAVYLLGHLFLGGRAPPAPFPLPGRDPTEDALGGC